LKNQVPRAKFQETRTNFKVSNNKSQDEKYYQ
jgi:hypothetical protein